MQKAPPISQEAADGIRSALADRATAAEALDAANRARTQRRDELDGDEAEAQRLQDDTDPSDARSVAKLVAVQTKITLYPKVIAALDRDIAAKTRVVESANAQVSAAVAAGVKELAEARLAAVTAGIAAVTDESFAKWAAPRAPQVSLAYDLASNLGASALPKESIAALVLRGELPGDIRMPERTPAALIALSNSPARNVSSAGPGGYTHVTEQRGGFVIR